MSRVVASGGGDNSTTQFSERFDADLPTSYPTYLGSLTVPTYFPTHHVPTKKETKIKDNENQLRNMPSIKPTIPPSIKPTTRPTTRPSKMPTSSSTELPTVSQEGDRTSRQYSSSRIGNEDIADAPTPESSTRQGQPYSRKHTPEPTVLKLSIPAEKSTDNKGGQLAEEVHKDKSAKLNLSFEVHDKVPSQSPRESVNKEVDVDRTAKLHLSFEIDDVPSHSPLELESISLDLGKAYDKLDNAPVAVPGPTLLSDEPTYYIFPTSTPIDNVISDEASLSISVPTYMPTSTENERSSRYGDLDAPLSTTKMTNNIDLTSIFEKRTCPGYPMGIDPLAPKVEEEVFFAYSVQTNTDFSDDDTATIELVVEWIQLSLLDDVAKQLLLCPTNDGRLLSDTFKQPVSRVYYNAEDDTVATLSECTPTFSNATDCAIVQSAIYVTVDVRHGEEARVNALSVINSQLGRRGMYESGDIIHVSYLGPSMNEMNVIGSSSYEANSILSSSINFITFYIAIGVVSLALCALTTLLVMVLRVRKERKWAMNSSKNYTGYWHTTTENTQSIL